MLRNWRLGDLLSSTRRDLSRDQPGENIRTRLHFLPSVLNLIMQLSESFFTMKPDEGDINQLKETG